jgi:hypothetical protein
VANSQAHDDLRRVAARQEGVVDRRQALSAGLASSNIARLTAAGRWRTLLPGVYAVHDQPVGDLARVWAAVLYVGRGGAPAVASGVAVLWLAGVVDECPAVVEVTTTAARRVRRQVGLRVRVRSSVTSHPTLQPPRQRLEQALLDVVAEATRPERVVDLVLRAGQRRLTTPDRLRAATAERSRLRWRWFVEAMCADLSAGVHSVLEGAIGATSSGRTACRAAGATRRSVSTGRTGTGTCATAAGACSSSWTGAGPTPWRTRSATVAATTGPRVPGTSRCAMAGVR